MASITKDKTEKRRSISWASGLCSIFIVGVPSALSFGVLSDFKLFGKTIFDLSDYLVSNLALPLGALLISLFVGYKLPIKLVKEELALGSKGFGMLFNIWYFSIRFIVPIGIIAIFLHAIGLM